MNQFLKSRGTQLLLLKEVEKKLNITQPTDWYKYGRNDVIQSGGKYLLSKYYNGSLSEMLKSLYSGQNWDVTKY
jgi:hypothetical protein